LQTETSCSHGDSQLAVCSLLSIEQGQTCLVHTTPPAAQSMTHILKGVCTVICQLLTFSMHWKAISMHICMPADVHSCSPAVLFKFTSRRTVWGFSFKLLMSCSIFSICSATSQVVKRGFSTASASTSRASGTFVFTTSMLYAICTVLSVGPLLVRAAFVMQKRQCAGCVQKDLDKMLTLQAGGESCNCRSVFQQQAMQCGEHKSEKNQTSQRRQ
jgi:hypothetical protein